MEWYKRNPADYRKDTWHLSLSEHGAYNLLLDHYYLNETSLPDNDAALASICGISLEEWLRVSNALRGLFTSKHGNLRHKRCDEEIEAAYLKRKDGAKRVAKYRKNNNSVTRLSRVSNATEERRGEEIEERRKTHDQKSILADCDLEDEFNKFWIQYPRKVGKGSALKAFKSARKRASQIEIMDGVMKHSMETETNGTEKRFIPYPSSWLNGDHWGDEPTPKANGGQSELKNPLTTGIGKAFARIENKRRI